MILSVHNDLVRPEAIAAQKRVMSFFGQEVIHHKPKKWTTHGGVIDRFLESCSDWEYLITMDVDCIPLDCRIIPEAKSWALDNFGVFGVAQNPNHIPNAADYVGPAFLAISRSTYERLGKPSFAGKKGEVDNAGAIAKACRNLGGLVKMLRPTKVDVPKWQLSDGTSFGLGTEFEGRIYHAFQIFKGDSSRFVSRCLKVCQS